MSELDNSVLAGLFAPNLHADSSVGSDCQPKELARLSGDQQARLTKLLDEYLSGLEQGESADIDVICDQNPDLADALQSYLGTLNKLYGFANGIRGATAIEAVAKNYSSSPTSERTFQDFQLGDFRILRELGRGGMGIVYEAEQVSIGRKVAIKLMPMTSNLDQRQIARFKNESQAAGQLNHPHIVPIYSVGADQGIHYYAMQLIDGVTIDRWIELQVAGKQSSESSWRDTVRWAIDVAEALHIAHQHGVVHRDIKPSNLMLDNRNHIWITDFGLARCQADSGLTHTGDVLGTFRYMSPEQANGRREAIDHRTDIYSLGVTLYEMLTQQPAFSGQGPSVLESINNEMPARLKKIAPHCPADLDIVLRTAMAKRKDDRYLSAKELASDLRAVLDGQSISASPPALPVVFGRWAMRHSRLVTASALVVSIGLFWLLISSALIVQSNQTAHTQTIEAERYFNQAKTTVDHLGAQVADQLASVPGAEHVRRSVLKETLAYYEQFAAQASNNADFTVELASTHNRIGDIKLQMESPTEAIRHFRISAKLYSQLLREQKADTSAIESQILKNLNDLALALFNIGKSTDAENVFREILKMSDHDNLQSSKSNVQLAVSKSNYGMLLVKSDRNDEALPLLRDAERELSRHNTELARRALSATLASLSSLTHKPTDSIALLDDAIKVQLALAKTSPNRLRASAELAVLYNSLGSAQLNASQLDQAKSSYQNAIQLQRQLHTMAPNVIAYQQSLAQSLNNLALVLQRLGNHHEAISLGDDAAKYQRLAIQSEIPESYCQLGVILHNQAVAMMSAEQFSVAAERLAEAIRYQQRALKMSPELLLARDYLLNHYSNLLRCHVTLKAWSSVDKVAHDYRKAADGNPKWLEKVASDLREIAQLVPVGAHQRRTQYELALTRTVDESIPSTRVQP